MRLNSLSGRFAALTFLFVLLAEVLILLPALAAFRVEYLQNRLERGQIASLAVLASEQSLAGDLERELLQNAGVYNVVLRRDDIRQLTLSSPLPGAIDATYDLRNGGLWSDIQAALAQLADPRDALVRIIGAPVNDAGQLIEVTMDAAPLRAAMADFAWRLLLVSAAFSVLTAVLLNLAAQRLILIPIRDVIGSMAAFGRAPEDPRAIITPRARIAEIAEAEAALAAMQTTVRTSLRQKERLAQLGQAVAKISHDLRNILTTGQILADRLEASADPAVRRAAPKLVAAIARAVHLCETTLAFGKAEEPAPTLSRFPLGALVDEVLEAEALSVPEGLAVTLRQAVPPGLSLRGDRDQLYRVIANLVRNARQAIEGARRSGTVAISAGESETDWWITVADDGPGLPDKAREHLFEPFSGGVRKGGSGLGLSIAADLVRGHGGTLTLARSDVGGTVFDVRLPREPAAEGGPSGPEMALASLPGRD